MRGRSPLMLLVAIGTLLAGCTDEAAGPSGLEDFAPDEDFGGVRGVVTGQDLLPIGGARVSADGTNTTTDEAGEFRILRLTPGSVEVEIEADGFFRVRETVSVRAGQISAVQATLAPMPSDEPYTAVYILAGFSTCEVAAFVVVTALDLYTGSCPLGEPKRSVIQAVPDSWRYGVVEMEWATADSFALYIADDLNCLTNDPCYAIKFGGHAPLRLDMAPGDQELAAQWASDGETTFPEGAWEMWANVLYIGMYRDEVGAVADEPVCRNPQVMNYAPGCPSAGVSTGIRYDTYVSVFNHERPAQPERYTALPDA